jgi:hypothetical protein
MVSKQAPSSSAPELPEINWATITNLADARAVLGKVVTASEALGDGSEFITDKNLLVKSPFLVLDYRFVTDEKTEREYVNVLIMGTDGSKARFNDGSTGVYQQLKDFTAQYGPGVGIEVKGGLRRSDYVTEVDGKKQDATTYYLST